MSGGRPLGLTPHGMQTPTAIKQTRFEKVGPIVIGSFALLIETNLLINLTVEQLAGDLLPDATEDQRIATGFHRTVTCNVEAGVHPEENRVNQVFDRVNTTGTVFLGTTLECCQCHNHKYDPFSQGRVFSPVFFF